MIGMHYNFNLLVANLNFQIVSYLRVKVIFTADYFVVEDTLNTLAYTLKFTWSVGLILML